MRAATALLHNSGPAFGEPKKSIAIYRSYTSNRAYVKRQPWGPFPKQKSSPGIQKTPGDWT